MENSEIDPATIKSPGMDRNVIEELSNLDPVAMRNLKDWDKKVGNSTNNDNTAVVSDGDKEWSPGGSSDDRAGATALSYEDLDHNDSNDDEDDNDSDVETDGSDDTRDLGTDYENSDIVDFHACAGDEDDERQCWVCFASQDDDPVAAWVHPCLCKGTTKWVHQVV